MFGLYKALYDYTPQDPETELALAEDQELYIIDKEDDQWWKAKVKLDQASEEEGAVGLVPSNYVEEMSPLYLARAIYAYAATNDEELTMNEDDPLQVFEKDDEWLLVKLQSDANKLGYVPASYVQEEEGTGESDAFGGVSAETESPTEPAAAYTDPAELAAASRNKAKADAIQTWVVSELDDKKKKKKGTLGVGNGAIFFASESDKTPIQQHPISAVTSVTHDHKDLSLHITGLAAPLNFHSSSRDETDEIVSKLRTSKDLSGGAFSAVDEPIIGAPPTLPQLTTSTSTKNVRWASSPITESHPAENSDAAAAVALYDFEAQGEDELNLTEGENLVILDQSAEDWWKVRNERGEEGVVPAQYVEVGSAGVDNSVGNSAEDYEAEERESAAREAAEAEAEANAKAQRRREREEAEAAQEAEARRVRREQEDRRRQKVEEKMRREDEAAERQRARQQGAPQPPQIRSRPSHSEAVNRDIPIPKDRSMPDRPQKASSSGRSRPSANRVRTWHDKSGQFKVEAEFLGLKEGKIRLHKLNGVVIEVPLEKMSPEDREYIDRGMDRRPAHPAMNEDDLPLAQSHPHKSRPTSSVSRDTSSSSRPSSSAQSQSQSRPTPVKKPTIDWFEFFLNAGCDMDDCTRYAAAFERDKIDTTILPDLDASTLRSLGLREGDVIRVRKAISARNPPKDKETKKQIESDEALARRLQQEEQSGRVSSPSAATTNNSASLFTSSDGSLKNQTRRGRPERKSTTSSVDATSIATAGDLLRENPSPAPPVVVSPAPSPPVVEPAPKSVPAVNGFDDDAWTPRPSSAKPTTPTPVAPPIQAPVSVAPPIQPATQGASSAFDFLAQIGQARPPSAPIQQPLTTGMSNLSIGSGGSPAPQPTSVPQSFHNGLGFSGSPAPMGQLLQSQQTGAFQQQQQPQQTGPRGPLAPVPQNQGLLNPLIPTATGFGQFIPTRPQQSTSPFQQQQPQMTGYQQQQPTGFQQQQPTGFQQQQPTGFQQTQMTGYQPSGGFMPQMTGMNSNYQQGQVNANANALSSADQFNALASARVQPTPQSQQQSFNPSNVFAAMKNNKGVLDASAAPQSSDKYDALRPQVTGFPGMMMQQPQQTGFMQPQATGYPMGGMGMQPPLQQQQFMQPQATGFMGPQSTGFNPYQQQQQTGYRGF
ncbi:Src homology-3 domain [Phaffia rhodozyma]|uniref:Actin cytoskeleton-regulatory complex protein SLA1 n=1 Tax=Phaffia rhodozyma TaxID=264483 RepID=A0A0F7SSB7_PHARH|nr:Src homology-3 domain [Phaffia rhodozyma]